MTFREATIEDIPQIQRVRHSVKENRLSDPTLVTDEDCEVYLTVRGKGWICEIDNLLVGFAIADLMGKNIWALFVDPEHDGKGIGNCLHRLMLDWYFGETRETVWLSTAPGTKAEAFYRNHGWKETGIYGKGEVKFEMGYLDWVSGLKPGWI